MNDSPSPLEAAFLKAARDMGLFDPPRPLLVAVSGGADSMALLHVLKDFAPDAVSLTAVHVHHGIRGRSADLDAAFVRARCLDLGIPLVEGQLDVPEIARKRRLSMEMAARRERYAFFRKVLADTGAAAVVTAHTADDQAETVLIKLIRGAGPRGLGGMTPLSRVLGLPVWRPFLGIRRSAIEAYLKQHGWLWREDPTNRDTRMLRNRVRRKLLPLLEREYNPGIREALVRTASVLRQEEEWLRPLAEQALKECTDEAGRLIASRLKGKNPALVRRVMRTWLVRGGVPEEKLDFDLVERLERLLRSARGTLGAEAGDHLRVVSEYGCWRVEKARATPAGPSAPVPLSLPGETRLPEWGLVVTATRAKGFKTDAPPGPGRYPCRAWLSAAAIPPEGLVVRARRPGDVVRLPGGSRKLQDWMTDAKVPRAERGRIPVVAHGGQVWWVAGGAVALPGRVPGARAASWLIEVARVGKHPESAV